MSVFQAIFEAYYHVFLEFGYSKRDSVVAAHESALDVMSGGVS